MADVRRIAAQHAETAKLMGVDFVPRYRSSSVGAEVEVKPSEDSASAASAPVPVQSARAAAQESSRSPEASQSLLDELRARYEADAPHDQFVTDHHSIVFGEGDPCADLMFIGEAPGAEEDKAGRPFVGRSGQLLEKMIIAMGLSRETVYIANVLKTRPPNNQTPTTEEARLCAPYLFDQIRIVAPKAIVTLGLPASRLILNSTESMGNLRGTWKSFPPRDSMWVGLADGPASALPIPEVEVMPTYHPAFLLRSYTPENRNKVWSDLQQVMAKLGLA